jgi:hypothetical protein
VNSLRLLFVLGLASALTSGLALVAGCGDGFSAGASDSGAADSTTDAQGGDDQANGEDGKGGGDDGGHDGSQAQDGDSSSPPADGSGGADGVSGDAIVKDGGSCPITVIGPDCFAEAGSAVCVDSKTPGFAPFCYSQANPSCTNESILCASGAQCPSGVNPVCCASLASVGTAAQCGVPVQFGGTPVASCRATASACTSLGGQVACATSAECPPAAPRCVEADGLPPHPDAGPPTPLFGICVP